MSEWPVRLDYIRIRPSDGSRAVVCMHSEPRGRAERIGRDRCRNSVKPVLIWYVTFYLRNLAVPYDSLG